MMTKLNVVAKSDGGPRPAANVHPLRKLGTLLNFSESVKDKCAKHMSERNKFSFGARSANDTIPIGFQMELEDSQFKRSILSADQVSGYNEIDREAIETGLKEACTLDENKFIRQRFYRWHKNETVMIHVDKG